MATLKLVAWVFMPTEEDFSKPWKRPHPYVPPSVGEVRLKYESDTPMSDETFFQPGWKRVPKMDTTI